MNLINSILDILGYLPRDRLLYHSITIAFIAAFVESNLVIPHHISYLMIRCHAEAEDQDGEIHSLFGDFARLDVCRISSPSRYVMRPSRPI